MIFPMKNMVWGNLQNVQEASYFAVVAATWRKHAALVTLLQNGTSWLNMYQTTVTACDELSSSRGREELAEAAGLTYQMDVFLEGCTLREARDDPDLHGLNFNLRHCDLLVPHAEGQLAGGDVRRYAGFRNLGNTCFINATLQVFLNVESLRSQIRNPQSPIVVNAGSVVLLGRVQQALKALELQYGSNKYSVIVPICVLHSVFL